MQGYNSRSIWHWLAGAVAVSLVLPAVVGAATTISLDTTTLAPHKAGQVITIMVGGGGLFHGVDLAIQVNDGGPNGFGTPSGAGPNITNVTVNFTGGAMTPGTGNSETPGTAYSDNSNHSQVGQLWVDQVVMNGATATATAGTSSTSVGLAQVTFDTTNMTGAQTFVLHLSGPLGQQSGTHDGDSDFAPPANIVFPANVAFTVTVLPEPASVGLMLLAAPAVLLKRRRGIPQIV